MICIVAENDSLISIDEVIDWLDFEGKEWERFSGEDLFGQHRKVNVSLDVDSKPRYTSVWYRSFMTFRNYSRKLLEPIESSNENIIELNRIVNSEINTLRWYLFNNLTEKQFVPTLKSFGLNKLSVLSKAKQLGLKIPKTIVTNNKIELANFYSECNGEVITKPLFEISYFIDNNNFYRYLTKKIQDLEFFDEFFFPSLFQKQIPKLYEIRVFFIGDKMFSMAIFSQMDKKTEVDFRNYNDEKPNRTVPYQLPLEIETKLKSIFLELSLNTGSADLIRHLNGDYYFLEINPNGQFGMTSKPCNYPLEREIAKYLS